jgi:hypothetical protein
LPNRTFNDIDLTVPINAGKQKGINPGSHFHQGLKIETQKTQGFITLQVLPLIVLIDWG